MLYRDAPYTGLEVIENISRSTQLCIKFSLLIYVKVPTIVGTITFMSRKSSILGLSEPKMLTFLIFIYLRPFEITCSVELSMEFFYKLGAKLLLRQNIQSMLDILSTDTSKYSLISKNMMYSSCFYLHFNF